MPDWRKKLTQEERDKRALELGIDLQALRQLAVAIEIISGEVAVSDGEIIYGELLQDVDGDWVLRLTRDEVCGFDGKIQLALGEFMIAEQCGKYDITYENVKRAPEEFFEAHRRPAEAHVLSCQY